MRNRHLTARQTPCNVMKRSVTEEDQQDNCIIVERFASLRVRPVHWQLLNLSDTADLAAAIEVAKKALESTCYNTRIFNLDWRGAANGDLSSLRAMLLRKDTAPVGFTVFSIRRQPLKMRLGEVPIADLDLTRHWHLGDPYFDPGLSREEQVAASGELVDSATAGLSRGECLFFESLPVEGPLRSALAAPTNGRTPGVQLSLGGEFEHQFIRMPTTFADYVAQLGSRSRQSVLYSQRRLRKDMGGDVRCECFESEESVDRFLADAIVVSRKTYQWNLLGLGLRDTDALRDAFKASARHGWFKSFILYCKGSPVAFMLGSQQEGCYYYDDVGYDPAFAKWSVGSVLQVEVLEHLFARADPPRFFDFSSGYGEHKGRFSNSSQRECNILVLPPTFRNRFAASAYRSVDATSNAIARVVERTNLKKKLKQLLRRRSTS
jgi:hypothetical protein